VLAGGAAPVGRLLQQDTRFGAVEPLEVSASGTRLDVPSVVMVAPSRDSTRLGDVAKRELLVSSKKLKRFKMEYE
jgi:hypothetical protein